MNIRLLSDLHIEGNVFYYEYTGEDVVVLAGDIHTKNRHRYILDQIPPNVKVIMVAGNHEYYGSVFQTVNDFLYELQAEYHNFYYLNNEIMTIGNVEFFGGTMFTNMNLYGDVWKATQYAQNGITDFALIDHYVEHESGDLIKKRWTVQDHIEQHELFCTKLDDFLRTETDNKRVVVTHFVPHPEGSDIRFANSPLNPYFITDMSRYMGKMDYWLYGHTHAIKDITVEGTRLVCNPRGYSREYGNGFNSKLIIEV